MKHRTRFSSVEIERSEIEKIQRDFFKEAGPSMKLMVEFMASIPGISFCVKNYEGRIVYTNEFNADISGWRSTEDMIGYTSEELYPPDQASVYAGRDREVLESGKPIVERIYGFVADLSDNLNCVTVRPVHSIDGRIIGTATVYWRAQKKMAAANWFDPVRKSIVYLNSHYNEDITVEELARISHYSTAQFRRLFKELTHTSPVDYIAKVRVNAAKTMLATTDRRISDIAVETGFFDHSHFIRAFRRVTGTTPAKYRRSILSRGRGLLDNIASITEP